MRQNVYTHYFKEAVVRDGVKYQHVIGLNEVWDWRLILDLAGDPAWQLIAVKRPSVCRFPGEKRRLTLFGPKVRCPVCGCRMRDCEDRHPEGVEAAIPLGPRPLSFERWHDEAALCPSCHARVGLVLRERRPALPAPKKKPILPRRPHTA